MIHGAELQITEVLTTVVLWLYIDMSTSTRHVILNSGTVVPNR